MNEWIQKMGTLAATIEATSIDPNFEAQLPPVEPGDEILGSLSPFMQKFHYFISMQSKRLQEINVSLNTISDKDLYFTQQCKYNELNAKHLALVQVFSITLAEDLIPKHPDIWDKMVCMDFFVRKGFVISAFSQAPAEKTKRYLN